MGYQPRATGKGPGTPPSGGSSVRRPEAVVALPGGHSIPVSFDGHNEKVDLAGVRARCAYCGREGTLASACDGCGGRSWKPLHVATRSPEPLPLSRPSLGEPTSY